MLLIDPQQHKKIRKIDSKKLSFKAQVANTDFTVFKIMEKYWSNVKGGEKIVSLIGNENWKIGKKYTTKMKVDFIHTYQSKYNGIKMSQVISEGFHSYGSMIKAENEFRKEQKSFHKGRIVLMRCTVPQGAKYYVSHDFKFVSNKLIVNEEIA